MTKSDGMARINGVEVGELSFTIIGPSTPILAVKYAMTNVDEEVRFGYGHRNTGWSDRTMEALASLVECIEADVCLDLFAGGTPTAGGATVDPGTTDGVPTL